MSRVDSARIAAQKAVLPLAGTVVASDAFFPFRDGIDEIAEDRRHRDHPARAARCATRRRSPPPTSTASPWSSPACATSGTDRGRVQGDPEGRTAGRWAALVLLVVVLFRESILAGGVFFKRDIHLIWHPQVEGLVRAVFSGALPLWDPSPAFGQPLLADPSACRSCTLRPG